MSNGIREILRLEIVSLEEEITNRMSIWQRMKDEHELHWAHRHAEGNSNDELEWEQSSSIREYYTLYIEPLEDQLAEKRRSLAMFK